MDFALVIILSIIKDFNNTGKKLSPLTYFSPLLTEDTYCFNRPFSVIMLTDGGTLGPNPIQLSSTNAATIHPQELEKYDCDMYYTGIFPKKTQSLTIVLKDQAIMQQDLTRNRSLVHLQCPHGHGFVHINVVISEKVHQGGSKIMYLLQNLKLIADHDDRDCATRCCFSLGEPKRNFQNQTEVSLTLKVLLSGVSACTPIINQTEIYAERELASNETKPPCVTDKVEERKKKSILIKALIICALLPIVLAIIIFVIFEVPFPCSCPDSRIWRNLQKRVAFSKKKRARKKKKEAVNPETSETTTSAII